MWIRIFIGALGGFAAAMSKLLAIDTNTLAALLDLDAFQQANNLKVMILIQFPALIVLGAIICSMTNETIPMKLFAIGVSAPAIIAPWMANPPSNFASEIIGNSRAAMADIFISPAYAGDPSTSESVTSLDALGFLLGLSDPATEDGKRYWVIVGSHKNLDEALMQADKIEEIAPQLRPFVAAKKPGNDYYPVIVGGEDAFVPLETANKLKSLAEAIDGVAPFGAYLSDYETQIPRPAITH